MPILTKEVEVIPMGRSIPHYREKGYDVKHKQPLIVKVEDLPRGSDTKIEVLCDMCHKNSMMVKYNDYNRVVKNTGSYVCKECSPEKVRKNNLKKYGVPSVMQLESFKEKAKQTNLERYGAEHYSKTEEFVDRIKNTSLERYGAEHYSQTEEYINRVKNINIERYGVDSYSKLEECQEKMRSTTEDRYGVPYYSQTQEYKDKFHNTCVERYGESYGKLFIEKALNTFYEKTGYNVPLQSPEVKEKVKQTCMDRFGYEYSLQSPEIREKISRTLYANSSQKASKQQRYICELYQGILNFPVKFYNADIYLQNDNLIIEYDGGGHMLNVVIGRETIEEYIKKEIIRDSVIKREGYKQMKIISLEDEIPSDQMLLQMLEQAKTYFCQYPNHSWIEFNISTSIIRNAEHKEGVPYDFGVLRKIS